MHSMIEISWYVHCRPFRGFEADSGGLVTVVARGNRNWGSGRVRPPNPIDHQSEATTTAAPQQLDTTANVCRGAV